MAEQNFCPDQRETRTCDMNPKHLTILILALLTAVLASCADEIGSADNATSTLPEASAPPISSREGNTDK